MCARPLLHCVTGPLSCQEDRMTQVQGLVKHGSLANFHDQNYYARRRRGPRSRLNMSHNSAETRDSTAGGSVSLNLIAPSSRTTPPPRRRTFPSQQWNESPSEDQAKESFWQKWKRSDHGLQERSSVRDIKWSEITENNENVVES